MIHGVRLLVGLPATSRTLRGALVCFRSAAEVAMGLTCQVVGDPGQPRPDTGFRVHRLFLAALIFNEAVQHGVWISIL